MITKLPSLSVTTLFPCLMCHIDEINYLEKCTKLSKNESFKKRLRKNWLYKYTMTIETVYPIVGLVNYGSGGGSCMGLVKT